MPYTLSPVDTIRNNEYQKYRQIEEILGNLSVQIWPGRPQNLKKYKKSTPPEKKKKSAVDRGKVRVLQPDGHLKKLKEWQL